MKCSITPATRVPNKKSNCIHKGNLRKVHAIQPVKPKKEELFLIKEKELQHLTYLNLDYFYVNKYTDHGKYNNNQHKATIVESKSYQNSSATTKTNKTKSSDSLEFLKMRIKLVAAQQLNIETDLVTNVKGSRTRAKQSNTTEQQRSAVNEVGDSYVVSIKIYNESQACFINEKKENSVNIVCVEKERNNFKISYQGNQHFNNQNNKKYQQKLIIFDKKIQCKKHAHIKIDIEILNCFNDYENTILVYENKKQQLWKLCNIENIFKNILLSLGINSLLINYDQLLRTFFNYIHNSQYLILPRTTDIFIKKFQRIQKYQEQQHKKPRNKLRESSANEESLIASDSFQNINNNNNNNNNNNKNNYKQQKQQQTVCVGVVGKLEKVNSPTIPTNIATFDVDQQVVDQQLKKTSKKLCHTQSTLKLRKFIVVGTRAQQTSNKITTVKSFYNNYKDISEVETEKNIIFKANTKQYDDTVFQLNALQMPERYIKKVYFKKSNLQHYQLKYKDKDTYNNINYKTNKAKMTIPIANSTNSTQNKSNESLKYIAEEESIYLPIWNFKTVGEAQDSAPSEGDYYTITDGDNEHNAKGQMSNESLIDAENVDDYGEWETDDDFKFTLGEKSSTIMGSTSINRSDSTSTRSSGAILPLPAGGQSTFAADMNESSSYQIYTKIAIFYSLSEPKMRAIKYDYDCMSGWRYFNEDSKPFKTIHSTQKSISSLNENFLKPKLPLRNLQGNPNNAIIRNEIRKISKLSDSVQAWKFMLLDINYIEDEEDVNVRENDLIGINEIKSIPNTMSRIKSASFTNLDDLPIDEDKKSIAERMRDKFSRGVLKLSNRSPKYDKKSRGIFRTGQSTSLYLADGVHQKYPIFGVPLEKLELNETTHPNVPRFVVDCIEYIEKKENICQLGVYRVSGNKVWIDEMKKLLSESYIYDARLLITDDINTLTSLLKQFFRQLPTPLIPQDIVEQIGRDFNSSSALPKIRKSFLQIPEPNRSTLKFLIQHLTNVAALSSNNQMTAPNLAIVWGPCLSSTDQFPLDFGRTNMVAKILIEHYSRIFEENERLVF